MRDSLTNTQQRTSTRLNRQALAKSMPTSTLKKQAGMSFIGGFLLMMIVAFLGLFAFKVVPSYIEYQTVKTIAEDVQNNAELMSQPKSKVNAYIGQAYRTNNLWDLKADDTIVLTKDSQKGYKVEVNNEKRQNLISNIYVVTKFNKVVGEP